jgi:hypothetical protein
VAADVWKKPNPAALLCQEQRPESKHGLRLRRFAYAMESVRRTWPSQSGRLLSS